MKTAKLRCVRCLHQPRAIKTLGRAGRTGYSGSTRFDALLDYQDYPIPAAKRGAMGRRTLGIGVINFAYWLAKRKRYSDGSASQSDACKPSKPFSTICQSVQQRTGEKSKAPAHGST